MNAEERANCRQMALELGVSEKSLRRSGALRPEMTEAARATLINHIKRGVRTPHNEPMVMPGGVMVRESTETITLTIRKQPSKAERDMAQRADSRADRDGRILDRDGDLSKKADLNQRRGPGRAAAPFRAVLSPEEERMDQLEALKQERRDRSWWRTR